ncbi:cytochrome b [Niveibacterium terrae]|uniref:cytochrome b n=1 Tax=Niveibacterium terrae TaxID=3373598 RepID=UPI003A8FDBD8
MKGGGWLDSRFPAGAALIRHLAAYRGSGKPGCVSGPLLLLVLLIQLASGLFLAMHYKPDASLNAAALPVAFASVETLMREVPGGALLRYMHSTGASLFFALIYLHLFRGLLHGSYRAPRELLWLSGWLLFLTLIAESFFGYLLPWGQLSYWGAQVVTGLFSAIPLVGSGLTQWVRGAAQVGDATLGRFFALHVIALPLVLIVLSFLHVWILHSLRAAEPDGADACGQSQVSHPPRVLRDLFAASLLLLAFAAIVLLAPEGGGHLLAADNFAPADPLHTPPELRPMWYFAPFYSMLRAVTPGFILVLKALVSFFALAVFVRAGARRRMLTALVWGALFAALCLLDARFWGVAVMATSVLAIAALPWLDRSPARTRRGRGGRIALAVLALSYLGLGWLGGRPVGAATQILSQVFTALILAFFALLPVCTGARR